VKLPQRRPACFAQTAPRQIDHTFREDCDDNWFAP
jgi:hypothetical protein